MNFLITLIKYSISKLNSIIDILPPYLITEGLLDSKEKTPNNFIARESSFKDKTFIPYDLDSFRVYHSDYQI